MKKKPIIMLILLLIIGIITIIGLMILAYGYGGGKGVKPLEKTIELTDLKSQIQKEVNHESVSIDIPRQYKIEKCPGNLREYVNIFIDNDSLKNDEKLPSYANSVNMRLQKIFPYDKKCYDSVVVKLQYFDIKKDSTINKHYSFPMLKK